MAEIHKSRVIRPSTRQETSINYKVGVEGISVNDTLVVEITHESNSFREIFRIEGKELIGKKSIHFQVVEHPSIRVNWKGIKISNHETFGIKTIIKKEAISETTLKPNSFPHLKTSLQAIEDSNIKILILGTMPGEQSLLLKQYYSNPRNRFWNIISSINDRNLPSDYNVKTLMLLSFGIGLWDVLYTATRKSSLDSDIKDGVPNDIDTFIANHKKLKIIGFNGKKAEELYDRHFDRNPDLTYLTLPSTSSANTTLTLSQMCRAWKQVIK